MIRVFQCRARDRPVGPLAHPNPLGGIGGLRATCIAHSFESCLGLPVRSQPRLPRVGAQAPDALEAGLNPSGPGPGLDILEHEWPGAAVSLCIPLHNAKVRPDGGREVGLGYYERARSGNSRSPLSGIRRCQTQPVSCDSEHILGHSPSGGGFAACDADTLPSLLRV